MTARVARIVLLLLVLGVTGCDQASKGWAEGSLANRPPTSLISHRVDLEYAQNRGVAFNLEEHVPGGASRAILLVVGLGLMTALGAAWWKRRDELSMRTAGYAIVLGGAAGNLLDRVTRGYVVDWVHVHGWPVFNVADVAIGVGAGLLILSGRRREPATS
jgi:signal peptidase II